MAEVTGLSKLVSQLTGRLIASKKEDDVSVTVGYTQQYALFVHEDLQARHKAGKVAKFLETPCRQLTNDGTLASIVKEAAAKKVPLGQTLLLAGLRLQRESMQLVPIDTGALRASAFTRLEEGK